jgi:hypothetical protein
MPERCSMPPLISLATSSEAHLQSPRPASKVWQCCKSEGGVCKCSSHLIPLENCLYCLTWSKTVGSRLLAHSRTNERAAWSLQATRSCLVSSFRNDPLQMNSLQGIYSSVVKTWFTNESSNDFTIKLVTSHVVVTDSFSPVYDWTRDTINILLRGIRSISRNVRVSWQEGEHEVVLDKLITAVHSRAFDFFINLF